MTSAETIFMTLFPNKLKTKILDLDKVIDKVRNSEKHQLIPHWDSADYSYDHSSALFFYSDGSVLSISPFAGVVCFNRTKENASYA